MTNLSTKQEPGDNAHNPYSAPTSGFEAPRGKVSPGRWLLNLTLIQCFLIVVAIIAAFVDIESIIASGLILTPLGIIVAVVAYRAGNQPGIQFGVSVPAISVFCFLLIFANRWGPAEAQNPVFSIIAVFGSMILLLGFRVVRWNDAGSESTKL